MPQIEPLLDDPVPVSIWFEEHHQKHAESCIRLNGNMKAADLSAGGPGHHMSSYPPEHLLAGGLVQNSDNNDEQIKVTEQNTPLESAVEAIGNTPIVELKRLTHEVDGRIFAKLEYFNPGFSKKDRIVRPNGLAAINVESAVALSEA